MSDPDASWFSREAARIAVLALAVRLATVAVAFLANIVFPKYRPVPFTLFDQTSLFWDTFTRYDSGWYFQVARNGYRYAEGGRGTLAYSPVYPLLMRWVGDRIGPHSYNLYVAGILISWIAFVLAMIVLYRLARLDLEPAAAERAVVYAAVFPFAFFFGVVYPESLFLLLSVTSFYLMRRARWIGAGLTAGVASATRVNGIMMVPALAWIGWKAAGSEWRQRAWILLALVLATSGLVVYSIYVYKMTGHFFEWAATLQRWGYYPGGNPAREPMRILRGLFANPYGFLTREPVAPYDTLNGIAGLLFLAAIPFVWRRLGGGYALFVLANLWLPLSSGKVEGLGRYCAVLFPVFIWLATLRSQLAFGLLVGVSAMFYALCLALFTNLHPLF